MFSLGAAGLGVLVPWGPANGIESSAEFSIEMHFGLCSVQFSAMARHRQQAQLQKECLAALLLVFPGLKCHPGDPLYGLVAD